MAEQVDAQTAERLADEVPEVCGRQLRYLDYQDDQEDRTATLIASIEGDWPEPSKSYWANVARQYNVDAAPSQQNAAPLQAQNPTELHSAQTAAPSGQNTEHNQSAEADAAVAKLLSALETIATMQHAHRAGTISPCPVCVAWDALKEWSHRQGVKEQTSGEDSL